MLRVVVSWSWLDGCVVVVDWLDMDVVRRVVCG